MKGDNGKGDKRLAGSRLVVQASLPASDLLGRIAAPVRKLVPRSGAVNFPEGLTNFDRSAL